MKKKTFEKNIFIHNFIHYLSCECVFLLSYSVLRSRFQKVLHDNCELDIIFYSNTFASQLSKHNYFILLIKLSFIILISCYVRKKNYSGKKI
jgi:hypothetical protein